MADGTIIVRYKETPSSPYRVHLMYKQGKQLVHGRSRVGDVLYSESGAVLKIAILEEFPKAVAEVLSGDDLKVVPGLGSLPLNNQIPKGRITHDEQEASDWVMLLIPTEDEDRIRKEYKEPASRLREGLILLNAGRTRGSTAQAVVGGASSVTSSVGRAASAVIKGASSVAGGSLDFATDSIKYIISNTWDRMEPWQKGAAGGVVAAGIDYLIRKDNTEAIAVGGLAGGGLYLYTKQPEKTSPTLLESSNAAVSTQEGYEKIFAAVMAKKGGTSEQNRARALETESEWISSGTHRGIPLDKLESDESTNSNLRALIKQFKSGRRMTR